MPKVVERAEDQSWEIEFSLFPDRIPFAVRKQLITIAKLCFKGNIYNKNYNIVVRPKIQLGSYCSCTHHRYKKFRDINCFVCVYVVYMDVPTLLKRKTTIFLVHATATYHEWLQKIIFFIIIYGNMVITAVLCRCSLRLCFSDPA